MRYSKRIPMSLVAIGCALAAAAEAAEPRWEEHNGHWCRWHRIETVTPLKNGVQLSAEGQTFGLGNARCSKLCAPCRPHDGACLEGVCFPHRPMPLEATITDERAESVVKSFSAELGVEVEVGAKVFGVGADVTTSLKTQFGQQWEDSHGRSAGISQTIPPICFEPNCKVSVLPVEGLIDGEGSVEVRVEKVDYYYVNDLPYHSSAWHCNSDDTTVTRADHGTEFRNAALGPIQFKVIMDIFDRPDLRRDEGICTCRKRPSVPTVAPPVEPPPTPPASKVQTPSPGDWDGCPVPPEPPTLSSFGVPDGGPRVWFDPFPPLWGDDRPKDGAWRFPWRMRRVPDPTVPPKVRDEATDPVGTHSHKEK